MKTQIDLQPFTFAQGVESTEDMALYLSIFLEENDFEGLITGLRHIIKVKGISQTARLSGLSRQHLYRIIDGNSQPKLETIAKLFHALGLSLSVKPAA